MLLLIVFIPPQEFEVIKVMELRNRLVAFAKKHPREARFLCFFAAFAIVWMHADNIESFTGGFFDGLYDARHQ